eukprot:TRINITY_DN15464_c0_g1_i1.p2 TRINITY_DN15464_c0_g1~~TRINITY_DN15464_c0_g1_i1.p2  ORF type:complete len:101 (+),score=23.73 TRINITY_DN15464_c0_g1_i1:250-552(+)
MKLRSCSKDSGGAIDYDGFLQGLDLEDSDRSRKMFQACDLRGNGCIESKDFIEVLARYAHISDIALGSWPEERLSALIAEVEEQLAEVENAMAYHLAMPP